MPRVIKGRMIKAKKSVRDEPFCFFPPFFPPFFSAKKSCHRSQVEADEKALFKFGGGGLKRIY